MPPRTFSLDISRCSSYVCKSCLDSLRPANTRPFSITARTFSRRALRLTKPQPLASRNHNTASLDSKALQKFLEEEDDSQPDNVENNDNEPLVTYWEQDATGKRRPLRDLDEFNMSATGLDADVQKRIKNLEKDLETTISMLQQLKNQEDPQKADELYQHFKKILAVRYKGKIGPEGEEYGLLRIPGFTGAHQRTVRRLNTFFTRDTLVLGGIPKSKDIADCWKFYSSARKALSTAWENVPYEVWNFLWTLLSYEGNGVDNPNRMQHIYILSKDMKAAGVPFRDSQKLLAIEAMFIEGWEEEAIETWKKSVATLGSNPETFKQFYELGIRMLSLRGDTDRAQRAADTLLQSPHSPDPRILIPLIRALMAKSPPESDNAWNRYRQMRALLGEKMTIEDYDEIIAMFLAGDCMEYALQAFVDMMFSGAIDIRGKTRLPIFVGNHFFIGKWLKRLIGAGDLDGAYKVVVYAQSRGITTPAVQLNGLIGAWMRSETAENLQKAEALAWKMIQARLAYVHARKHGVEPEYDKPLPSPAESAISREGDQPEYICRTRASAETFCLLAESYCSRKLHGRLLELFAVLKEAEIGTTSFLMNQLIRSYSQNNDNEQAIGLYNSMTKEQGIRPDGHTFLTLFNCLSVNRLIQRDPVLARRDISLARSFFKDMVEADWTFDSAELFAQLPRTILFSMLKARDYSGFIVAARAMKEIFGFHPPDALLLELLTGIGAFQARTMRNATRVVQGKKVLDAMIRQHRMELIRQGHKGDELSEEEELEEKEAILEKIVVHKAKQYCLDLNDIKAGMDEAAHEMGVYDIVMLKDPTVIEKRLKLQKIRGEEEKL
ncbi:uncharacterized protein CTHT_0009380 [Thermochaetoides thermophila DSM 1495]|uniref:Pentatricopeptide repeat protein n=1 Tax=Chaetomium thermophilum (strain DSM 1495 / CBS 144.50 / IMI 039719) TaxID=759272 RepID=G0S0B0_CHATD|nr:hypothetical protein CTHT_0009380 [Thermochaetoides thermophila DSM 1495]EGS23271.1 hypothetical protein CTHT_0009380 [Thermochaetoides thermophila DSM 1495]